MIDRSRKVYPFSLFHYPMRNTIRYQREGHSISDRGSIRRLCLPGLVEGFHQLSDRSQKGSTRGGSDKTGGRRMGVSPQPQADSIRLVCVGLWRFLCAHSALCPFPPVCRGRSIGYSRSIGNIGPRFFVGIRTLLLLVLSISSARCSTRVRSSSR